MNTAYPALDDQVDNGRGQELALIYDSRVIDKKEQFNDAQLLNKVATFAGVLHSAPRFFSD